MKRLNKPELSDSEKDELFWLRLREAMDGFNRLYDQDIGALFFYEYAEKYPELNVLRDTIIQVGTLIEEKTRQKGGEPDNP